MWICPDLICSSCFGGARWNTRSAGDVLWLLLFPKITPQTFHGPAPSGTKLAGSDSAPGSVSFHAALFSRGMRGFFMACFQLGVTHPPQQPLASSSQVFSSESRTMEVAVRDVETAPRIKFTSPMLPWGSCFLFGCFFKLTFGRNWNILSFPSVQM